MRLIKTGPISTSIPGNLLEPAALVGLVGLYALNPLRFQLPTGYAGLYALMTELTSQNLWHIPFTIPYYGPGGIPFAYPLLGIILASTVVRGTGIGLFTYLRWAPPAFTLVALILLYCFLRQLFSDRDKALVATVLAGFSTDTYIAHATAAGMVRGLAFALTMGALAAGMTSIRRQGAFNRWSVLAAILLGLSALTHLSYVAFGAVGLTVVFCLAGNSGVRERLLRCAGVMLGAIVTITPWLVSVIGRYGFQVLSDASQTHGTFGLLHRTGGNPLRILVELLRWVGNLGSQWNPVLLAGMALVGIGYAVFKNNWILPVWMLALITLLGETTRFEELIGSALAAAVLVDIAPLRRRAAANSNQLAPLRQLALTAIVVGVVAYQGAKFIYLDRPVIDQHFLEVGQWFQANTEPDAVLLLLPYVHSQSEWLPYLAKRTPAIGHWGAEWTGGYAIQQALGDRLDRCTELDSTQCLTELFADLVRAPDYLVLGVEMSGLTHQLESSARWTQVYQNEGYEVARAAP